MKRKIFLTFPQRVLGEPLIFTLSRDFEVVPNIQGATITEETGMMALVLDGEAIEIERAVAYLRDRGVEVETIADES